MKMAFIASMSIRTSSFLSAASLKGNSCLTKNKILCSLVHRLFSVRLRFRMNSRCTSSNLALASSSRDIMKQNRICVKRNAYFEEQVEDQVQQEHLDCWFQSSKLPRDKLGLHQEWK